MRSMKKAAGALVPALMLALAACSPAETNADGSPAASEAVAAEAAAAGGANASDALIDPKMAEALPPGAAHVGEKLERRIPVALAKVRANPSDYMNQTLLVEATADDICQVKGCWMTITDGEADPIWVTWSTGCGGAYEFPKDAAGQKVLIQGSFYAKEISEEDAEHLAEEAGGDMEADEIAGETFEMNATACVLLPKAEGAGA